MIRVFVSSPYSHPDPAVMDKRAMIAGDACAWLMGHDRLPYSPIAHWHGIARRFGLPTNANYWAALNEAEVKLSDEVVVLALDGWRDSQGVAMEVRWATNSGIPVRWLAPAKDGGFSWIEGE